MSATVVKESFTPSYWFRAKPSRPRLALARFYIATTTCGLVHSYIISPVSFAIVFKYFHGTEVELGIQHVCVTWCNLIKGVRDRNLRLV